MLKLNITKKQALQEIRLECKKVGLVFKQTNVRLGSCVLYKIEVRKTGHIVIENYSFSSAYEDCCSGFLNSWDGLKFIGINVNPILYFAQNKIERQKMIVTKKDEKIYIKFLNFPTVEELAILNDFNLGNFFICERHIYKRVLVATGIGHKYICMECPINEKFRM